MDIIVTAFCLLTIPFLVAMYAETVWSLACELVRWMGGPWYTDRPLSYDPQDYPVFVSPVSFVVHDRVVWYYAPPIPVDYDVTPY